MLEHLIGGPVAGWHVEGLHVLLLVVAEHTKRQTVLLPDPPEDATSLVGKSGHDLGDPVSCPNQLHCLLSVSSQLIPVPPVCGIRLCIEPNVNLITEQSCFKVIWN